MTTQTDTSDIGWKIVIQKNAGRQTEPPRRRGVNSRAQVGRTPRKLKSGGRSVWDEMREKAEKVSIFMIDCLSEFYSPLNPPKPPVAFVYSFTFLITKREK